MMMYGKKHLFEWCMHGVASIFFCVVALAFSSPALAAKSERCTVNSPCIARVKVDEFNSIKVFNRVNVGPLEGTAENLGLNRAALSEHVQKLFKEYYAGMEMDESQLPFTADEPRDLGYIRFTVRTVEVEDPVILHVLLKSGNYAKIGQGVAIIHIYDEDTLQLSSREDLDKDVKRVLEEMIKDLAGKFHDARKAQQ